MKKIILKESSFKKLLEYVGDEEALGRYDLSDNPYIPESEKEDIISDKTHETSFKDNSQVDGVEYVGQELNDPGPYSMYRKLATGNEN